MRILCGLRERLPDEVDDGVVYACAYDSCLFADRRRRCNSFLLFGEPQRELSSAEDGFEVCSDQS